jgi:ankyrin repeat domain-containing protein 17
VLHTTPDLSCLLETAKSGDSALAVKTYLDAGGSVDVLVHGAPGVRQLPLLHHMIWYTSHPHAELAESVRLLIEAGADINDKLGARVAVTPVLTASKKRCCCKALQVCLQSGGEVLAARTDGITALHQAASVGRVDSCELLLARDSSLVHIRDGNGFTALMHAVAFGSVDTVEFLLQYGADFSTASDCGTTLLMAACQRKRFDMAVVLIAAGADVNAVDRYGHCALMVAAEKNSKPLVQLLLHHGADTSVTDNKGQDALLAAAGHVRMLELLVQCGLSVTAVDSSGNTLLMTAVRRGHKPAAEWLLQQGVAVDAASSDGFTALHCASMNSSDDAALVELLLANGADVDQRAKSRRTALSVAACQGLVNCARVLIAAGADVNSTLSTGETSLHLAVTQHRPAALHLLLQHGAAVVVNSVVPVRCPTSNACCCIGLTTLMMCTGADTVKPLLAAGADVHAVTAAGDTCLHIAARHGLSAAGLCLMIKSGADLHAVNNDGNTAAQVAHIRGYTLTEQLLIRAAQQAAH